MRFFIKCLIFGSIFISFAWSNAAGNLKISFTEKDLKEVLFSSTPISFPKIKGIGGKIYVESFDEIVFFDENEILLDATVKGEKLSYQMNFGAKPISIDIGDVVFYLRLRANAFFKDGAIHYRLALEEQSAKNNPAYVGKFILPLMRAFFSIKDSVIEGKDILQKKTYERRDDEMEATFLIRGFEIKNKVATITVGIGFQPKPSNKK